MIKFHTHPGYTKQQKDWALFKTLYEGDHDTIVSDTSILWPLYTELKAGDGVGPALLKERRRRTRYFNIPEIIISILVSFFFKSEPTLSEAAQELLGDAADDIDGQGTNFATHLKHALEHYLVYGKAISVIDSLNGGRASRPYAFLVEPLDFLDWDTETADPDRVGKLNAARRVFRSLEPRYRLSQRPVESVLTEEYFIRDGFFAKQVYKLKDDNAHDLTSADLDWEIASDQLISQITEIPIVTIDGVSWIKDSCQEVLRHLNLRSSKDTIEHQQAYQKIFIKGISPKDAAAIEAISEHHYPILPEGADVVAVPPGDTSALERSISKAMDSAFKVGLNQLRQVAADSAQVQSAQTIETEKDDRLALVQSTLSELENFGNRIIYFFGEFKGQEKLAEEAGVTFTKELTTQDMDHFIKVYHSFRNLLARYPSIQPLLAKKVVTKLLDADDQEKAIAEIEQFAERAEAEAPAPVGGLRLFGN